MIPYFEYFIVVFLGLVLGSFATALIHRVPRYIPWAGLRRSQCPQCDAVLKARDLIPVFSWIFSGGKCRACEKPVGPSYVLTELAVLAGCIGVYIAWGFTVPAFILMACVPLLVALLVIDLRHMILPDQLVLLVALLALLRLCVLFFYAGGLKISLALYFIGGGLFYAFFAWLLGRGMSYALKRDSLGMGDIKFFAAAGLWLGGPNLGLFCLLAGLLGVGHGLLWKATGKGELFPFGPSLILSLYLLLIFQTTLSLPLALNYY